MGIFATLFGNPNADIVNNKIDTIINNLPLRQADKQFDSLVSGALNDIVDYTGDKAQDDKAKSNLNDIEKLLEGISVPEQRLRRYDVYDDVYKGLQLVKRIVKVYISNIFQKDPVSNISILLKETEVSKNFEKLPEMKQLSHNILKFFKLDEKLKYNTAFNMLKYGDAFVELIDLTKIETEFPAVSATDIKQANGNKDDAIITECYVRINSKNEYINSIDYDRFAEVLVEFNNEIAIDKSEYVTTELLDDSGTNTRESVSVFNARLQKIILKFHKPHKIVPLVSPYDNIMGYVEMREVNKQTTSTNVLKQFTDIIDKIGSKTNIKESKYDDVLKDLSKLIIKKLLIANNIIKPGTNITNDEYEALIYKQLGDDMFFSLKRTIVGLDANSLFRKKLSVRFILPENMFWFKTPSSDFYPYGCSVIDPLVHPAKLYIFAQLANSIYKLSRASQIRKWTVETGSKQDSSGLLQKLKRNFATNRITASDLTGTKDVANLLSDFRDMVIFTKHGQKFVDVEFANLGDPSLKSQDLDSLRQEIVSLSGIPSAYLNIPESDINTRDNVLNTNISMATEISNMQDIFNTQLTLLLDRIFKVVEYPEIPSKYILLQLLPPVVLTLQLVEASLVSVGNIFGTFKDTPGITISPVSLLKRYVPYLDWDVLLQEGDILNMKNKVITTDDAANAATAASGQPTF